jgi:hypothetical protein
MSTEIIHPSSLDGIKRLAKSIKHEQGIQHIRALDIAAQSAGFQNFRHAQNALLVNRSDVPRQQGNRLFLTAYWSDKSSGEKGRETLLLWLDAPWSRLIAPQQLKNERSLLRFRAEGVDHLVGHYLNESQSRARRVVCAGARTLQFMDATKLRPSGGHSRVFLGGDSTDALPGRDHYTAWYDPNSKRYLLTDEPYEAAALSHAGERAAWAERHGFSIVKPSWAGMYNPDGGSQLYLVAHSQKGISLQPLLAVLNRLPEPMIEATWDGESAPLIPPFISPGSLGQAKERAAVRAARTLPRPKQGNAVGYVQTFVGPQRRPNAKVPIEVHAQVGRLLKSVLVGSYYRKGVYNRVDSIRSELDEWTQREYTPTELPGEQFFDLYYHEAGSTFSRSISAEEKRRHVTSLEDVKRTLVEHYPDSAPLRTLLKKVDAAIRSMQSWH